MRHKARLKQLEADVRWLWTDGVANWAEGWFDFVDKKKQLEDYLAAHPEAARKAREAGYGEFIRLPPVPAPSPRPEDPQLSAGGARLQSRVIAEADESSRHRSGAPPAAEHPRPEEPCEARRLEGPATSTVPHPTKARSLLRADRDASLRDAPQGEVVVVGQGEARGSPRTSAVVDLAAPAHPYDPPEHMQIRPVTWRLRTAEDDWEDDDDDVLGPYQTVTEYDPLDDD